MWDVPSSNKHGTPPLEHPPRMLNPKPTDPKPGLLGIVEVRLTLKKFLRKAEFHGVALESQTLLFLQKTIISKVL